MAEKNDGKPPEEKDAKATESPAGDVGGSSGPKKDEPAASEGETADLKAQADVAEKTDDKKADDDPGKSPKGDEKAGDEKKASGDEPGESPKGDEKAGDEKDDDEDDDDEDDEDEDDPGKSPKGEKAAASGDDDEKDTKESEEGARKAEPPDEGGEKKPPKPPERKAQAWGRPLARLDRAWTTWEVWLCAVAVVLEVLVLTLWVGLKGLSTEIDGSSKAGLVFRALTGAIVLGVLGNQILKRKSETLGRVGAIAGILIGVFTAKAWGNFAIDWSGNLLNWYQQASFLTLWGGLRGVGTRLTLLLALLGGSLATAAGKHITIDLATRYMKPRLRLPVVVAGWVASSAICATAAWGFFDHIAIDDFGAKAEMRAGEKISHVASGMGENFFVARKQIALDFKSLPHVLKGERYSEWMSAAEWNAWVDSAGFVERYGKEKAELLKVADDVNRAPIVLIPEKGEPRGELSKAGNLVFPIGLFIISLRFILLALLALAGHKNVDPEAAHEMGIGGFKKPDDEPEGGEAR